MCFPDRRLEGQGEDGGVERHELISSYEDTKPQLIAKKPLAKNVKSIKNKISYTQRQVLIYQIL